MVQVIKMTFNDDSVSSVNVDVMLCSSMKRANEVALKEINKGFDGDWGTLDDAATELDGDISSCAFDGVTFTWFDNGKGETYIFGDLDVREINTKFQRFV